VLRVGLTGGIACGKSLVAARLARAGCRSLDLDRLAHQVIARGGSAHADVVSAFGSGILAADGEIDRRALGRIVFADPAARARLNELVHPRVRAEERRALREMGEAPGTVLVVEAAIIVETGQHLRFDRLLVAHCSPAEQQRRLRKRDGLDAAAAAARLAAQMPVEEKRRFAHLEVDTSGSVADTEAAVDRLAVELRELAARPAGRPELSLERAAGLALGGPEEGPRGLSPLLVLREIVNARGLEMERLARHRSPRSSGSWYEGARAGERLGAETLVGPLVLWALARAGDDPDFTAAAAASLARLVHPEAERRARTVLSALVLHEAVVSGRAPQVSERASRLAKRWGGSAGTPWHASDSERMAPLLLARTPGDEWRAIVASVAGRPVEP
jgi:dephospho-CoA kinase